MKLFKVDAKKRQGARNDIVEKVPQSEQRKARDDAARMADVNPHYVQDAYPTTR
jgi:hypothetical protein